VSGARSSIGGDHRSSEGGGGRARGEARVSATEEARLGAVVAAPKAEGAGPRARLACRQWRRQD
jgi:hypothetical protein